jgi:hypothetical protein
MVVTSSSGPGTLGARYEVPCLLTEVAPQEGLLQAFDALHALDAAINDAFGRVGARIAQEKAKIDAVGQRVARAADKVGQVAANATRVTTVFSTSKYPAPRVLPDFKRVLDVDLSAPQVLPGNPPPENVGLFVPPIRTTHRIAARERFVAAPPADTSVLYTSLTTARVHRQEHGAGFNEEQELAEGLGRLPSYLPSISSVLLFNSDENPYKQYVSINNLEGVGGQDRDKEAGGPSAAPKSLVDGLELPTYAGFTFEYKPALGELPTFDLPQNLPLGKLADITFGVDQNLSIAPSLTSLALPSFDMLALPAPNKTQQQPQSAVPASSPAAASSSAPAAPPAPSSSSAPAAPPMAPPMAPAAPAAPPMAPPAAPPGPPSGAPPANVPAAVASGGGGRGALLDAIRDAKNAKKLRSTKGAGGPGGAGKPTGGRAGLKPASARDGSTPSKAPPPDAGGDMMAALRERMARRQQVMAGKADVEVKPATAPVAARRVSLAPPRLGGPPRKPAGAAAAGEGVAEGEEEAKEESSAIGGGSKMSSAVLSAYVNAHNNKNQDKDKDEEWE